MAGSAAVWVATAVIGYTALQARDEDRNAATARQEQIKGQRAQGDLELRKSRLEARRQARAARAQVLSAGEASGVAPGSTAIQGSTGSIRSTSASQDNFLSGMGAWQGYVLDKQGEEAAATARSKEWSAWGSLASTVFSLYSPGGKGKK